jgi:hypothetical protein
MILQFWAIHIARATLFYRTDANGHFGLLHGFTGSKLELLIFFLGTEREFRGFHHP